MKNIISILLLLCSVSITVSHAGSSSPAGSLVAVTILVKDYDEAATWYSETLGFQVSDNKDARPGHRWVTMSLRDSPNVRIILHKLGTGYMDVEKTLTQDRIGKETFWILQTDDFDGMYRRLIAVNARFQSEVRPTLPAGKHVVFEDLYGNLWVLEQRFSSTSKPRSGH